MQTFRELFMLWASIAVSTIAVGTTLFFLLVRFPRTLKLYKRHRVSASVATFVQTARSHNLLTVFSPTIVAVLSVLIARLFPNMALPLAAYVMLGSVQVYGFLHDLTPPSVLLLASSRWEAVRLYNLLDRGLHPYRVTMLLDAARAQQSRHARFHWDAFLADNLRLAGDQDWMQVIRRFARLVPVIIIDARHPSPPVIQEVLWLLSQPEMRSKLLFLTANDGSEDALVAAVPEHSLAGLQTTMLPSVVGTIRRLGLGETSSPDDSPILAPRAYNVSAKAINACLRNADAAAIRFTNAINVYAHLHGWDAIGLAAHKLHTSLEGSPDDGPTEMFKQLSGDIALIEVFLSVWSSKSHEKHRLLMESAWRLYASLCLVQGTLDRAPPSVELQLLNNYRRRA